MKRVLFGVAAIATLAAFSGTVSAQIPTYPAYPQTVVPAAGGTIITPGVTVAPAVVSPAVVPPAYVVPPAVGIYPYPYYRNPYYYGRYYPYRHHRYYW